jgi:hypothetical protein
MSLGNEPSKERIWFWGILLVALLLRMAFVLGTPAWQSPDEYPHYWIAEQIALRGDYPRPVPLFPAYESFQPPLYYGMLAGVVGLSHGELTFTEVPAPPPRVLIIARIPSVIFGVLTLLVAYAFLRRIPELDSFVRLSTVGFLALLPSFVGVTSTVTNDSLVVLLSSISLLYALREPVNDRSAIVSGIWGGLALLVKMTAIILVPVIVVHMLRMARWKLGPSVRPIVLTCLGWLVGGAALVVWNVFQHGHAVTLNPVMTSTFHLSVPQLLNAVRNLTWSFWLAFGRTYDVHLGPAAYAITALPVMLLAVVGWRRVPAALRALGVLSLIAVIVGIAGALFFVLTTPPEFGTSWGKYVYPLLLIIAPSVIIGLSAVSHTWGRAIIGATLLILAAGCFWGLLQLSMMSQAS